MVSKGKAMVTGGAGALGSAVAVALRDAGYEVHAIALNQGEAARIRQLGEITPHVADLTRAGEAKRAFDEAGGPLAAVVATVGGFRAGPVGSVTGEEVDFLLGLNFKTTILTMKAAYPHLKANPGGAGAVLVAAKTAFTGGPGVALYSATKAAVLNLGHSLSQEWLDDGISVNVILPATIDTPDNRKAMPDADASRWPKPAELARVVAFLVGPDAHVISGAAIPVYGKA